MDRSEKDSETNLYMHVCGNGFLLHSNGVEVTAAVSQLSLAFTRSWR